MKLWKNYGRGFLALLLIFALLSGISMVPGVYADDSAEDANTEEMPVDENGDIESGTVLGESNEIQTEMQNSIEVQQATEETETSKIEEEADTDGSDKSQMAVQSESLAVQSEAIEIPYTMTVDFAGQALTDSKNEITTEWKAGESKSLQVTLKKNSGVVIDTTKAYLLCIKVSELFYFNGLPDVSGITGADRVAIKKNAAPKVYRYNSGSSVVDLPGFSQYSGEIRILLNTSVDMITIPNMSVSFNQALAGYVSTGAEDQKRKVLNVQNNPLQVRLVAVDKTNSDLEQITYDDENVLNTIQADSVQLTRGNLVTGGSQNTSGTNFTSLDKFATEPSQVLNKRLSTDDTIGYAIGTAGMNAVYCKTLTVVFNQPYITKDGMRYYLSFDKGDSAFSNTKKNSSVKGYQVSDVNYDEQNHTFTYTFKDIYLDSYQKLLYTPDFSWPTELTDDKEITEDYTIQGYAWKVTEQTGYTDDLAGWWALYPINSQGMQSCGTFGKQQSDVHIASSANPSGTTGLVKRVISPNMVRSNAEDGIGALGFFDIHNDGVSDSPKVKITFDFNTDNSNGTMYYITRVNLPSKETTIDVNYTLINDEKQEVKGIKTYTKQKEKDPHRCYVEDLRKLSNVDNTYYIKELSYTATLKSAYSYHAETAHAYRNRVDDCGLYFGYLEGSQDTKASADLTIEAVNEQDGLNKSNATKLTSTEVSRVGSELDNYIGFNINSVNIAGQSTASITAGGSTILTFNSQISSEEYSFEASNEAANGYHVFKDGIIYICLPDGVSILGTDQVKVTCGGEPKTSQTPQKLEASKCTVNGTTAYWWAIEVKNINANAYKFNARNAFSVRIQLDTSMDMAGVAWNFEDCIAVRVKNQGISWTDGGAYTSCRRINKVSDLEAIGAAPETGLANYLETVEDDKNSTRLGINIYRIPSQTVNLNIARAEAKLDVDTALVVGNQTSSASQVKVTDAQTEIQYRVTVSSEDKGYASNFAYYIPVVSKKSTIDASALTVQNEVDMVLQKAVTVTQNAGTAGNPFKVYYTTAEGLTSDSIRGNSIQWVGSNNTSIDYAKVTAIKIATDENAQVTGGSAYEFNISLKVSVSDFDKKAGCTAQWKSFGHYTYTKNKEETTNTYPSALNGVTVGYDKDMTGSASEVMLDTAGNSPISVESLLPTSFEKAQTFYVKKVKVSEGTQLISGSPSGLIGTAANNQFQLTFDIIKSATTTSLGQSIILMNDSGMESGKWTIPSNEKGKFKAEIAFSTALTETVQERYVDITVGNDDVNVVWRVKLIRKVQPANASASRIVAGEHYQVPKAETAACKIGNASAFSALYVIDNFTPGNYTNQTLTWMKQSDNQYMVQNLPKNTSVIMMEIAEDNTTTNYWYYKCKGTESNINLNQFKRMGGSENYSYTFSGTNSVKLRYLFVVNFKNASASTETGNYQLVFGASAVEGAENVSAPMNLEMSDKAAYSLSTDTEQASGSDTSQVTVTYSVNSAENDSSVEGKTMALVLTPTSNTDWPKDAVLQVEGNENVYHRNLSGDYIIPVGTIASGSLKMTLVSQMFPDTEQRYAMTAKLYIVKSLKASYPMNGNCVADANISFEKIALNKPALRITGTTVASAAEWGNGQEIAISMSNISTGKMTDWQGIRK